MSRRKQPEARPIPKSVPAPAPAEPKAWVFYAILCGIVLVTFYNSFGLGLALDGRAKVLDEPRVRALTSENIHNILAKHYWSPAAVDRLYRPLTLASLMFNYAVLGNRGNPAGYHVVNVLLHMLNVCLLFELALLVLRDRKIALLAAALWAVHPVQTEVVANIAGRADLLATAAVIGSLLIYIQSIAWTGMRKMAWLAVMFVVALAGVLSKESAAVLIGLMLLWDVAFGWNRKPGWASRQAAYLVAAATLCILAIARWKVFSGEPWPAAPFLDNPIRAAGFIPGRLTAFAVIGRYLGLLVWPAHLSFDYAYNQIPIVGLMNGAAWLSVLVAIAIVATVVARYRADRTLFWAAGFFGIALLPTANLVFPIGAIMAVRFLYLPSIGFAIAAAALAARIGRPRITRGLLIGAVAILGVRTIARNMAWDSDLSLAGADVVTSPASFRTHEVLAEALYRKDHDNNLDAAIREQEMAWHILEQVPPAVNFMRIPGQLGMLYYYKGASITGDPEAGRRWLEKAAAALEKAGAIDLATARQFETEQAARGLPLLSIAGYPEAYLYLGRTCFRLGRIGEAVNAYRTALRENPSERDAYNELADLYAKQGDAERAAIVIDAKAFVLGMTSATATTLHNLYSHIPGGECAVSVQGGAAALNMGCPRVRSDMCKAWVELDSAYRGARQGSRADSIRAVATGQYGCPAASFAAAQ